MTKLQENDLGNGLVLIPNINGMNDRISVDCKDNNLVEIHLHKNSPCGFMLSYKGDILRFTYALSSASLCPPDSTTFSLFINSNYSDNYKEIYNFYHYTVNFGNREIKILDDLPPIESN